MITEQVVKTVKVLQQVTVSIQYKADPQKIMNKSAVLWFEFLSKRFEPGASSAEIQVRWNIVGKSLLNIPLLTNCGYKHQK